jgi:hypothetical protein
MSNKRAQLFFIIRGGRLLDVAHQADGGVDFEPPMFGKLDA